MKTKDKERRILRFFFVPIYIYIFFLAKSALVNIVVIQQFESGVIIGILMKS